YEVADYVGGVWSAPSAQASAATPVCGALSWVLGVGGPADDQGRGIAVGRDGSSVVVGDFSGTVDFGGGSLTAAGTGKDAFVAKYSSAGQLLWVRALGGIQDDVAYGVALGGSGNVMVVGTFNGVASFGGVPLTSAGQRDGFVARY